MKNPITAMVDEFKQVMKDGEQLRRMPETSQYHRDVKQRLVERYRNRRLGKADIGTKSRPKWNPGGEQVAGIPSGVVSQLLYDALLAKGASPEDAQMYVLNSHIGDNPEWNEALLESLK